MNGWIKLHRKLIDWEWYTDTNTFRLFIHFLLNANHEPRKWKGIVINSGQLVTGLLKLSEELDISIQSVRTSIVKLKSTHEITIKSNRKYSLVTIQNWKSYQDTNTQINKPTTNQQQTTNNKQEVKKKRINTHALRASMKSYNENQHQYDMPTVDPETGTIPSVEKKSVLPAYRKMLDWSEKRRGKKFVRPTYQYKAFKDAREAGIEPADMRAKWIELEQKGKDFDWNSVVASFDRKQK